MRYGAIIAAAGMSERMDQVRKQMKVGDPVIAERIIVNFRNAGVRDILIVAGDNAGQLEKELKDFGVDFLRSSEISEMFDTVRLGISALSGSCSRIFFCPLGVPFFTDRTVREEMRMMETSESAAVVVPTYRGKGGHPLLIDSSAFATILSYTGNRVLRGACDALPESSILKAEVPDEGSAADAGTGSGLHKLLNQHNERILHPVIKLTFSSTSVFFGPGTVMLLREIEKCGNVREACARCGFSYSKGWTIIRKCEEKFGWPIVERQAGGSSGGKASVTDKGRDLLAVYDQMHRELTEAADERFRVLMKEYRLTGEDQDESDS